MKRYLSGMHKHFNQLVTWLPDEEVRLGDVGVFRDGHFSLRTTLANLNVPFRVRPGATRIDLNHSSGKDVSMSFNGAASTAVAGAPKGSASIELGSSGAFFFHAVGVRTDMIENRAEVGKEFVLALRRKAVEKDWLIVDEVRTAESATILVIGEGAAAIDLTADAPLGPSALANTGAGLKIKGHRGELTQIVARESLTPMYGLLRIKSGLLGGTSVKTMRGRGAGAASSDAELADDPLERLRSDEWLAAMGAQ